MVQVVWFKRDLRTQDHAALSAAANEGPVLPLYVVEPEYWALPDTSARQWRFTAGALADLQAQIAARGGALVVRRGDVVAVLAALCDAAPVRALWSHEETGNDWTFARDRRVRAFCKARGLPWREVRQFGVHRGGMNRDRWAAFFEAEMGKPCAELPADVRWQDAPGEAIPQAGELALADDGLISLQPPGRARALALLDSFFAGRGRGYQREMSSPLTAPESCSRLSAHLAVGSLSMREAVQRCYRERARLSAQDWPDRAVPLKAVDALIARLHWHCHFIQKLEAEPQIEWRAQHPAFEAARLFTPSDDPMLRAWATGRTGFPFVDACMRSLIATGWINFRMRAMLMAFASYHLALDWRVTGQVLARLFTDYEPGIHWPQVQMQSGQTGINTPRIYNPVKQSFDQDPDGVFIRAWAPELARLPTAILHQPWKADADTLRQHGVILGETYPAPVVDHEEAARAARARLSSVRRGEGFREEARAVFQRHGSRKRRLTDDNPAQTRAINARKAARAARQLTLDV
jgi:deoxyribodipyrimidine photo-lyase